MSAPTIVSVSPTNNESDVVLGSQVTIVFDQAIDNTTVNSGSFVLNGPGQTQVILPNQLIAEDPQAITGREYIQGTFSFALDISGRTVATFNPSVPLQPNLTYTVTVLGADGVLLADGISNLAAEKMANTFRWSFVTGDLNVVTPPVASPLPAMLGRIDPSSVLIVPRGVTGNDLTLPLQLIFPDDIDPASIDLTRVLVSVEPMLGDPLVVLPASGNATVTLAGKTITVSIPWA